MYRVTMVILKRQALHSTHPVFSYKNSSRWWFQIYFIFTPNLGEINDPIWRLHIFQMGWQVQPPTSHHSTCFEFPGFTTVPNGIDQGHSGGANAAGDWGCQVSLPETDSKFAPEKWMVGRRVCFLFGFRPIFQVLLLLVSGRGSWSRKLFWVWKKLA